LGDYLFEQGQTVRVLKHLDINVGNVLHLLGQKGIVVHRYKREKYNENWYDIQFPNGEVEPFCEYELDARFVKKKYRRECLKEDSQKEEHIQSPEKEEAFF
jgi:hypothetical protein